jgi:hypothetical protein
MYGGVEMWLHAFLTSALDEGWTIRFTPDPFTHGDWAPPPVTRWMGPKCGLDTVVPARNLTPFVQPEAQSLYWPSYPDCNTERPVTVSLLIRLVLLTVEPGLERTKLSAFWSHTHTTLCELGPVFRSGLTRDWLSGHLSCRTSTLSAWF